MLFYNEQDEICMKYDTSEAKKLYDYDIVYVGGKHYTYVYGFFYDGIDYGDGDYKTDWGKRTHPRHMNIVEMSEI